MKLQVLGSNIQIDPNITKSDGPLDTSSRSAAKEFGKVLAVGEDVKGIKKGDKLFYKSWGVDLINHEGKEYVFVNQNTNAILAIIHEAE